MPDDFVIARNPEPASTLLYLLRIPLGDGIILKAKDTWPRTGKVYCHRVEEWPDEAEIIERTRCAPVCAEEPRSTWCSTAAGRIAHRS